MAEVRAAFFTAERAFEIRERTLPEPGAGEVRVGVRACGICGSDLHWFHGAFPPPAVCPGHEIAGEIEALGKDVEGLREGDRVVVEPLLICGHCPACRIGEYQVCSRLGIVGVTHPGGFADAVIVPARAVFPIDVNMDPAVAALAEPVAVCVHAVRIAPVRCGDRVLVLGAGTIGLLSALAARAAGASEVWITARYPAQTEAAEKMGVDRTCAATAEGEEELRRAAAQSPVDVVIETVGGGAPTLAQALEVVRPLGSVAVLGVFTGTAGINGLALVAKEIRIVGSMTYGRAGRQADFDIAIDLIRKEADRLASLVTHRFPLESIADAFATAADKRRGSIKVSVLP